MTVDPAVIPGLLLLAAELLALAAVGFVVARVALRQTDNRMALAQGLVIGPALWGLIVNFVMYLLPGMAGAAAAWVITLTLAAGLAWRASSTLRLPVRTVAGFAIAALALFWIFWPAASCCRSSRRTSTWALPPPYALAGFRQPFPGSRAFPRRITMAGTC